MRSLRSFQIFLALALTGGLAIASIPLTGWAEKMPTEPRGGKPPAESKASVENLADQVTYQRAFEAVVSMPAVIK